MPGPTPFVGDTRRIVVVGTTGSGKTTLASQLSRLYRIPHVEMDALRHDPGWTEAPNDVFRERLARALAGDRWVADGNYSVARDVVWPRAQAAVWLDYPLRTVMWQLLWRTLKRCVTREELWNGNRERFRTSFFSRESVILWALTTYRRRRRQIPQQLALPEHSHLAVVRLRSRREMRSWLEALAVTV